MPEGEVRLRLPYPDYISEADLEELAGDLRREGFEAEVQQPLTDVAAWSYWDGLAVFLDHLAEGGIGTVMAVVIAWAQRRWRRHELKASTAATW